MKNLTPIRYSKEQFKMMCHFAQILDPGFIQLNGNAVLAYFGLVREGKEFIWHP